MGIAERILELVLEGALNFLPAWKLGLIFIVGTLVLIVCLVLSKGKGKASMFGSCLSMVAAFFSLQVF